MKRYFCFLVSFFVLIPTMSLGFGFSIDLNKIKDTISATQNLTLDNNLEQELEIGRTISGRLLGAYNLVNDKKLQNYVNKVGRWVATQSERKELNWQFGVIDVDSINAFSAPGGYIFVYIK